MKTRNIISLVLIFVGLISAFYLFYGPCPYGDDYASCGFGRGMIVLFGSYPAILLGIFIWFVGLIVDKLKSSKK